MIKNACKAASYCGLGEISIIVREIFRSDIGPCEIVIYGI